MIGLDEAKYELLSCYILSTEEKQKKWNKTEQTEQIKLLIIMNTLSVKGKGASLINNISDLIEPNQSFYKALSL